MNGCFGGIMIGKRWRRSNNVSKTKTIPFGINMQNEIVVLTSVTKDHIIIITAYPLG